MIHVSCFASATEISPMAAESTWPELVEFLASYSLTARQRSDKKCCPAMTLAHIDGRRCNDNVVAISGIAADIDIGPDDVRYRTFEQTSQWLREQGWAFIIYTTTKSSASHNRFRIVLIFEHAIPRNQHLAAWTAVNEKLGGVIDGGTKDPARLSFLPANWQGDYRDDRSGNVTEFENGFNAFTYGDGGPILTAEELQHLPQHVASTRNNMTVLRRARPIAGDASSPLVERPANVVASHLAILADWERSPYISDWMREIAAEPGQRDFKFLCAIARRALRIGLWIDVELLAALGSTFSHNALGRLPPDDLRRQAKNALEFAKAEPR